MPGNTTTSTNFTGLYGAGGGSIVPTAPYGNANVVSLLAEGTDGANTITNISATGNIYAENFFGNITGNLTVPGSTGQVIFNNGGLANASPGLTFTTGSNVLSVTGNVSGSYFIGNGAALTGLGATYSNANVVTLLASFGSNTVSTTGNITGGYILGNGSQLTGLGATYSNANVVTLMADFGSNVVSTTGNITGGYILGNGSQLTGLPATYGNANVVANLAALGSNPVSTTGNITAGYFIGNGSQLTGLAATYGNANVSDFLASGNNTQDIITTATVQGSLLQTSAGQGNIIGVNYVSANFYLGDGGLLTNVVSSYGNANVVANLAALGTNPVSTTGNITAGYFIGNGSQLTGIVSSYGNANVVANLAALGSNPVSTTGNVTAGYFIGNGSQLTDIVSSYGNANVVANLAALGTNPVSTTGNVTAGYFIGNGSQLTGIVSSYGNANVATFMADFGSNVISTSGNITGGNINSAVFQAVNSGGGALKNATGTSQLTWGGGGGNNLSLNVSTNISGANAQIDISPTGNSGHVHIKPTGTPSLEIAPTYIGSMNNMVIGNVTPAAVSATTVSASGNIVGGNILTVGVVSATGNVTGNFFIGNGSQLTGVLTSLQGNMTGNITGGNLYGITDLKTLQVTSLGNIRIGTAVIGQNNAGPATIDITAAELTTNLLFSAGGNISGGNILTVGLISATSTITSTANITGGNILTGGLISATGNITAGTGIMTAVSVSGNITGNSSSNGVRILNYKDNVSTITYAATITPDAADGSIQQVTLTGNVTWNAFGGTPQAGQSMVVKMIQDGTGNRLLSSTMKFAGNTRTLSTAASSVDIISVFFDGTSYFASLTKGYV